MMLCVIALVSGCATPKGGSYCAVAQRPFQWRSDAEIDSTPIRVLRHVETEAELWKRLCQRVSAELFGGGGSLRSRG